MNELERARVALAVLLYRNPIRHDGHAYELELALWGLGLKDDRPAPSDFGEDVVDDDYAMRYAEDMATAADEESGS